MCSHYSYWLRWPAASSHLSTQKKNSLTLMPLYLALHRSSLPDQWPELSEGKLHKAVCDKALMKRMGKTLSENARLQKTLRILNKGTRECLNVCSCVQTVCVCVWEGEALCNGKQGINNPNRMREMVNTTKSKRVHGSIHPASIVIRGWIHCQRFTVCRCVKMELWTLEMKYAGIVFFPA